MPSSAQQTRIDFCVSLYAVAFKEVSECPSESFAILKDEIDHDLMLNDFDEYLHDILVLNASVQKRD